MTSDTMTQPNKTTALLAYILDMGSENPPDRGTLTELVDAICTDPEERGRLISAVAVSQNPEIRLQVLELLGRRLQRQRDMLDEAADRDEVIGIWSQRLAGGAILAGAGAVVGGLLTGVLAAVALTAPMVAGVAATVGRDKLRKRARVVRRLCEETESLIKLLSI